VEKNLIVFQSFYSHLVCIIEVVLCLCLRIQIDSSMVSSQYKWWEEDELRDLCASVGLEAFVRERSWRFIMFSVRKPSDSKEL